MGGPQARLLAADCNNQAQLGATRKETPTALSDEARDRIVAALTELRHRRERLVADLEGDEDTVGDRGDAADEIQLAEDLGFVDRRISELEKTLQGGALMPSAAAVLPDGAEVTVKFPDGQVATMRVISVVEQIPVHEVDETLTADSPLGLALAGHQPGDVVSYATPHGQEQVELLAIRLPA